MMINTDKTRQLFEAVISKRGIHHKIGKKGNAVRQIRHRHKTGKPISLETQLLFLQKAGVTVAHLEWSDKDMVALLRFYNSTSEMARQFGVEYVFEKFKQNRSQL